MAANGIVREALGDLDARLDHWKQTLVDLCRIPSMSATWRVSRVRLFEDLPRLP